MFKSSISLVLPVYNEAEIIEETISIFVEQLSSLIKDFEVIIINDGSNDDTGNIITRLSLSDDRIKVVNNSRNIGSGASLWQGFMQATKDLVISNFADRPFNLTDLKQILPLFEIYDIDFIVVARKDRSAATFFRKLTSYTNFFLIRTLFKLSINDFQFVQIYKRPILKKIRVTSRGTFVPPELMIRLTSQGYIYKEVKSHFYKRPKGKSKCGNPKIILQTLKEMFIFWFFYNTHRTEIVGKREPNKERI